MRELNQNEIAAISGGYNNDYNFAFVVGNTATGMILGCFFPGISEVIGATALIANPALALGAVFGVYALTRLGANALDNIFFPQPEQITILSAS